ncbi:hypothetical protein DXG03_001702 [Asterophora parasitica]|uniref:glucan endo-1,3-beta-D-glucosidase n=1 Tax=Asterophora parasitica TaxID=117018 RepID=A0A9P7KEZ9_9AGAR|nr:hypothetical protein DXG03_001702 [Asterophora parasitica]
MYTQAARDSVSDVRGTRGAYALNESDKPSDWLVAQQASNRRSKWIVRRRPNYLSCCPSLWGLNADVKSLQIIGSVLGVIALIIAGVVVGVVVSKNHKSSSSSSGGSKGPAVNQTNPNDPSTFIKNPALHQSFYGLAYTPAGSQLPNCGNKLADVITDIQLISQLTNLNPDTQLEAIKQTKVDMKVWLGNYAIATDNGAAYQRQRDVIKAAIQTYGTNNIGGVTVGNEFMLNYLNANGGTVPDSPIGNQGAQILINDIQDTRSMLSSINVNLPVGTSDAGSYFNTEVLQAVDYGVSVFV